MTGVIWVVQLVHYPSFSYVGEDMFPRFHRRHVMAISLVVVPLMLGEFLCGLYLAFTNVTYAAWVQWVCVCIIALTWLATFCILVPLHVKLNKGKDPILIRKLTKTNWIRTGLWTIKTVLILVAYTAAL